MILMSIRRVFDEHSSSFCICFWIFGSGRRAVEDVNIEKCFTTEQIIPDGYVPLDYIDTSIGEGCKRGSCCGTGTKWLKNTCVPTREGMIKMCEQARGQRWAWTCSQENFPERCNTSGLFCRFLVAICRSRFEFNITMYISF